MNAHGQQGLPQMTEQSPNAPPPPHGNYPPNQPPPNSSSAYMNGSPSNGFGQSPRGMPTPSNQQPPRQEWGYGYRQDPKRKSVPTPPQNMPRAPPKPMPSPSVAPQQGLADVDPESVPANMKVEGQDWFALFNPKAPRLLKVDLVHTLEHPSVVCCVKFSADGRYLAAGCNRATFIYDVATSQRVA